MSDTATRAAEALHELRAELAHADALITEQQRRIEMLEDLVRFLERKLNSQEGAA
jgi:hypothetical protein